MLSTSNTSFKVTSMTTGNIRITDLILLTTNDIVNIACNHRFWEESGSDLCLNFMLKQKLKLCYCFAFISQLFLNYDCWVIEHVQ